MPGRIVREGILRSERVNALSAHAEVFYRRLMSVVDDWGRFEANLEILTSYCYPLTSGSISRANVSEWLAECCQGNEPLIVVYEFSGKKYLQINNFGQRTRSNSKFPSPNDGQLLTDDGQCQQNSASRARSNTTTHTDTDIAGTPTDDAFELSEPADWYRGIFIGEFPANTWREIPRYVNTPELLAKFRANTPLWMLTSKYSKGFGKDAIWFLRSGVWHNPPAPQLIESSPSNGSITEAERLYRSDPDKYTEDGYPRMIMK